jgi:hypothetical protein
MKEIPQTKGLMTVVDGGNSPNRHLGYHSTQQEAALTNNKAAVKHHGEFANPNEL